MRANMMRRIFGTIGLGPARFTLGDGGGGGPGSIQALFERAWADWDAQGNRNHQQFPEYVNMINDRIWEDIREDPPEEYTYDKIKFTFDAMLRKFPYSDWYRETERALDVGITPEPPQWMEQRDMSAQFGTIFAPWQMSEFPEGSNAWSALNAGRWIKIKDGFIVDVWDRAGNRYTITGERIGGGLMPGKIAKIFGAAGIGPTRFTLGEGGGAYQDPKDYPRIEPAYWYNAIVDLNDPDLQVAVYFAVMGLPEVHKYHRYPGDEDYSYWNTLSRNLWNEVIESTISRIIERGKAGETFTWGDVGRIARQAGLAYLGGEGIDLGLAPFSEQVMKGKVGGGMMTKVLPLRNILMAAASLGDLLSLLRKVKDPTKEVTDATKKLEDMVTKYDGGAKAEDVPTAMMKRILTNLKKVKSTEDRPRTRVLKAIKLLEDLIGSNVKAGVLQASIVQVARILKAVEEPTDEIKEAIKLADQLAKSYEEGAPAKYGKVVSVEGMTKLLKMLEKIEEKPDAVVKAVSALKKLLGGEEEPPVAPGERGKLPSYGVGKLESAMKPGVYRARLIRAGEALDGTDWDEEQLKAAFERGLFEGIPVNAISYTGQYGPDVEYHLPLDTKLAGKVVGNQVGFVQDTSWDDEEHAGYGLVYITEAERRNLIDAMLEQGLDAPGMSIYADGTKDENNLVTGINGVYSMDLVTFPAADGAILSQALTASVKEWGMMKKRVQAAKTESPPYGTAASHAQFMPGEGGEGPIDVGDWASLYDNAAEHLIIAREINTSTYMDYLREHQREIINKVRNTFGHSIPDNAGYEDEIIGQAIDMLQNAMYDALQEAGLLARDQIGYVATKDGHLAKKGEQYTGQNYVPYFEKENVQPEPKVGGAIMDQTAVEKRLDAVEKISQNLNGRVVQADTDGMIEQKLQASKLPDDVQKALRGQLLGKQLETTEVESFIKFQQGVCDTLAGNLATNAGVTLEGGLMPQDGKDTLEGALTALFDSQVKK